MEGMEALFEKELASNIWNWSFCRPTVRIST